MGVPQPYSTGLDFRQIFTIGLTKENLQLIRFDEVSGCSGNTVTCFRSLSVVYRQNVYTIVHFPLLQLHTYMKVVTIDIDPWGFPNLNIVAHFADPVGWGSCMPRLATFETDILQLA